MTVGVVLADSGRNDSGCGVGGDSSACRDRLLEMRGSISFGFRKSVLLPVSRLRYCFVERGKWLVVCYNGPLVNDITQTDRWVSLRSKKLKVKRKNCGFGSWPRLFYYFI
jgi:hypothetical protein